jgi:hypothetical protein
MHRSLVAYKKKFPQFYKVDPKLARWVHNQRQCCKDKNCVDFLNSIGPADGWKRISVSLHARRKRSLPKFQSPTKKILSSRDGHTTSAEVAKRKEGSKCWMILGLFGTYERGIDETEGEGHY